MTDRNFERTSCLLDVLNRRPAEHGRRTRGMELFSAASLRDVMPTGLDYQHTRGDENSKQRSKENVQRAGRKGTPHVRFASADAFRPADALSQTRSSCMTLTHAVPASVSSSSKGSGSVSSLSHSRTQHHAL